MIAIAQGDAILALMIKETHGAPVKRKRLGVEEILGPLDRTKLCIPLRELRRDARISERTFSRWKKECTALESEHHHRPEEIAEDIRRLKRIIRVRESR